MEKVVRKLEEQGICTLCFCDGLPLVPIILRKKPLSWLDEFMMQLIDMNKVSAACWRCATLLWNLDRFYRVVHLAQYKLHSYLRSQTNPERNPNGNPQNIS